MEGLPARDGQEFAVHVNGGEWIVSWHSAYVAPDGTPHGAAGICLTADDGLGLISNDGRRWGLPGGRPEEQESWEQTLRREILEEACARVVRARLLGFSRGVCVEGPEEGLVLVRTRMLFQIPDSFCCPRNGPCENCRTFAGNAARPGPTL